MVTRIGGLASGMDIDSIVAKLMTAEKTPLNKLYQKKQTAEWQRDAYRSVNTKMKTFSDYTFDNLLLSSNFIKKTPNTTGTNGSKVTVNAGAGAAGNLDIQAVKQLATNAKTSVATAAETTHRLAKGTDTLDEFGASVGDSIKLNITNASGTVEEKIISFDASDTVDTLINNLKTAGLTKSAFNATTGKFTFAGADYSIADASSAEKLAKIGFLPSSKALADATTKDTKLSALGITAGDFKLNIGGTEKTFTIDTEDTIESFLTKLNATDSGVKATFDEKTKQFTIASTTAGQTVTATDDNTFVTFQKLGIRSTATVSSTLFIAGEAGAGTDPTGSTQLGELGLQDGSVTFNVVQANGESKETKISYSNTDTIDSLMKHINTSGAGITALFSNGKLTIGTNNSGLVKDGSTSSIQVIKDDTGNADKFLTALGLKAQADPTTGHTKDSSVETFDLVTDANEGQSAIYAINGLIMESNSNQVNVSGYEINLNGTFNESSINGTNNGFTTAPTNTVSVSSTNDIGFMVDKIKEFVTKYNEFIGGINEQLKETKYRSFAPLTEEQRKDMSEHEQKLWDEKAKSGLLRSDSILRQGLSDMRSALGGRVSGLGDNVIDTLAEMGITTSSSYNDGGKLVIEETKLRKALSDDPDRVINTLTQTGEVKDGVDTRGVIYRLRDAMSNFTKKIDAKAGRTTMTDSQYSIGKNLVDMDKRIDVLKMKLENIETRYWKQFTAMEKAISKANQQSSFFTTPQ